MSSGGFISLIVKSAVALLGLSTVLVVNSAAGINLTLKKNFSSGKKNICLSDIVSTENAPPREAEKLARYCRIEFKAAQVKLTAKEVELHAWAAGVIPEKISGAQIVVTKSATIEPETKVGSDKTQKMVRQGSPQVRRGTAVKLILKSENMTIAREAAVLMDAFPGETVDVRLSGTRKNLRARLVDTQTAEVTP